MHTTAGEPGIGKTRLLDELTVRARERGATVLEGRAAEFEQSMPFGPWVDALEDTLGDLGEGWLRSLGMHGVTALAAGDLDAVAVLAEAGAATAAGAPATAARWFGAALELLPEHGPGSERRVELLVARASAAGVSGRPDECLDALKEVLEMLPREAVTARVGLTAACAQIEHAINLHHEATSRLERAAAELPDAVTPETVALKLERALELGELHGAARVRDAAIRELRRSGRRIHRRSASGEQDAAGLEALTQREREIAELVWERYTNRQIGEALFLSPKTVENHLRNIFNKVRVSSRVELAREVERAR